MLINPIANIRITKAPGCYGMHMPTRASAGAAGLDVSAYLPHGSLTLNPGRRARVPTGLIWEIPPGYVGQLFIRSGLALHYGLSLANQVGIIDADYRGELCVALRNSGDDPYTVRHGDRIAQLLIVPVATMEPIEVGHLSETERGSGGFGSTGAQ